MRVFLRYEHGKQHQFDAMVALASGLAAHGIGHRVSSDWAGHENADVLVSWNDTAPVKDRPRLMLEAGYINHPRGDYVARRLRFISTSWNGLHGRSDLVCDFPDDRWRSLGIHLKPWRTRGGKYALLLEQVAGDATAPDRRDWLGVKTAVQRRWRWIKERPHPLTRDCGRKLSTDLRDAALAITWSSNAAVEAVIAGVPTIALDQGATAWPVTSHSLYDPLFTGDREQWAYNLAYRQWTLDELASGLAWEHLN